MSAQSAEERGLPIPVLLFVRKLDWGGIERDVAKLAVGLDRARITPHVAVFQGGGLRYDEVYRAGVPILDLHVASFASPRILGSAFNFARYLRAHRIQVVHAFDATAAFAVPLARAFRIPVVFSSTLGHRDLFDARTRKQVEFSDRFVDAVVVNCEAMRRHMVNDYSVPLERTILSYNGVDTTEFFPLTGPKPEPVSAAALVIGSVCVLRPEKRMDMLVEAFAPVCRSHPGTKLLIVGGGPELPKLQAKAAALSIERDCIFQPAVEAVAPYLRAMDIFVSCSSSEAFSNSILEAMACGCCPVGSRVGGTPELISDGQRGLLFESGNVAELSQKLALLAGDPELRRRLAQQAAAFAAHSLSMELALERMSGIYQEQLRKKRKQQ